MAETRATATISKPLHGLRAKVGKFASKDCGAPSVATLCRYITNDAGRGCAVLALVAFAASGRADPVDPAFAGRLLLVASDGDMEAQAYSGEVLGKPARDLLSIFTVDAKGMPALAATVPVSNSVVGPPASLTTTPDGRYAIVVETRGKRPKRPDARLIDLPPGRAITVVDLGNPAKSVVVQRIAGRTGPISVSVSPDGKLVAIAYDTTKSKDAPLDVRAFDRGQLGAGRSLIPPGFEQGESLKNAAFAPNGALALVYATRPRLSLVRIAGTGVATSLTRWGDDVPLGQTPFEVRFTPDGRFALVNDMTVPPTGNDVRGTVTSIELDALRTPEGSPVHRIVSTARTGVQPEGLAVSPDGRWIATTNLERTAYKPGDTRQGFFASVTLLRIDGQGRLVRVGDYPFAGIIPEAAAFDDTSRFLAVAVFDHLSPRASRGSLDIWRLAGDFQDPSRTELVPTGISVPLARGAQSMSIVRACCMK